MKYKEIIEKTEITTLEEDGEKYYIKNKEDNEISVDNKHDKIFRKMLDIKIETAKFINKALNLSEEKLVSKNELEKYTNRFITTNLLDKESDVIYKIKGKNIFILIEHQTQIDYKMSIRILEYSLGIIKSAIDYSKISNKDYEMPTVIPIVLYTGKTKWRAKRSISEKQEVLDGNSELKTTKYNLVDANNYTEDELLNEKTYISKIMLLEKHRNTEELTRYLKAIVDEVVKYRAKYSKEAEDVFIEMVTKILIKKIGLEKANEVIRKLKGVDENMLASLVTIEQENRMIFNNGKKEGKKEGRNIRNIEIIKNMIKENLPLDLISKITGKTVEEIEKIKFR